MGASEDPVERIFADSNIWLYALLATEDADKSAKARVIIQKMKLLTSVQVINEVCVNVIKKAGYSEDKIQQLIVAFHERHLVGQLNRETLLKASALRERYGFSFWDGTMLASALAVSAQIFYTEDMQDGLIVEKVCDW